MDAYNVIELVGEGSFGKVYKARRRFTGQIVVRMPAQRGAIACASAAPAALCLPSLTPPAPTPAGYQIHHEARQERERHPGAAPGD